MDASLKILMFFFMGCATSASDLSLMLSAEEEAALARAQEQARKGNGDQQPPCALRLDGIIYSHPNSWAICLNGRFIKAHEPAEALQILKVTPEFAEMRWNPKPDESYQITLKPNEAFQSVNPPPPTGKTN